MRMCAEYRPARSASQRANAPARRLTYMYSALYTYTGCSRKTVYILPTILRPIWNWRFLGVKGQSADILSQGSVGVTSQFIYTLFATGVAISALYISNSIFCPIKEIFCHNTYYGLYFMKLQRLLKNRILQFRSYKYYNK